MTNWKTTASGLLAALGQVLPLLGVAQPIAGAISIIGLALLGLLSKDYNVTGGTVNQ